MQPASHSYTDIYEYALGACTGSSPGVSEAKGTEVAPDRPEIVRQTQPLKLRSIQGSGVLIVGCLGVQIRAILGCRSGLPWGEDPGCPGVQIWALLGCRSGLPSLGVRTLSAEGKRGTCAGRSRGRARVRVPRRLGAQPPCQAIKRLLEAQTDAFRTLPLHTEALT